MTERFLITNARPFELRGRAFDVWWVRLLRPSLFQTRLHLDLQVVDLQADPEGLLEHPEDDASNREDPKDRNNNL